MTEHQADELIPTRQSLLSRLKDWDDQEGWRDFFGTYWKLIYGVARKAGLSDAEAQDVVQETVLGVAKKMREFKYDPALGSFKGWLMQLTRWCIGKQLRKRPCHAPFPEAASGGSPRTPVEARIPDPASLAPDAVWDEEWQKNLRDAALERVKQKVNPRQYQIFDFYVIKQLPVKEVARALEVSAAQVYLAKHRVGGLVKEELKRLEEKFI